jgi:hypothetical protein
MRMVNASERLRATEPSHGTPMNPSPVLEAKGSATFE